MDRIHREEEAEARREDGREADGAEGAAAGAPVPLLPPVTIGDNISTYFVKLTAEQIARKKRLERESQAAVTAFGVASGLAPAKFKLCVAYHPRV